MSMVNHWRSNGTHIHFHLFLANKSSITGNSTTLNSKCLRSLFLYMILHIAFPKRPFNFLFIFSQHILFPFKAFCSWYGLPAAPWLHQPCLLLINFHSRSNQGWFVRIGDYFCIQGHLVWSNDLTGWRALKYKRQQSQVLKVLRA